MTPMTRKALLASVACCALVVISLSSAADPGSIAQAKKNVAIYYTNTNVPPPAKGPKAVKGKEVYFVDAGFATPAGAAGAKAVKEAGKLLGWNVTAFDGKFTPSVYQEGIRQAIASKADGIVLFGVDCPVVKTALEQAKKAKIAVVGASSQDCSQASKGSPSLFTASVQYPPLPGSRTPLNGFTQWYGNGVAQADWLIAQTNGKAKVLLFRVPDFAVTLAMANGFKARLSRCAGCSIVDTVDIGVKDFGPALQGIAEQALLKNPDATAVNGGYADLMTLGIASAIVASGRNDKLLVVAGTGNTDELNLVRQNKGEDAGFVQVIPWDMYTAFDQLNRIFAGVKTTVSGYAMTMYDKNHNVPSAGPYVPKANYKATFAKIWAGRR